MEKSNLDSKKSSKQHEFNEGFSGKNINPSSQEFKTEFETDAEGITTEVERARYSNTEMDIPKPLSLSLLKKQNIKILIPILTQINSQIRPSKIRKIEVILKIKFIKFRF